MNQFNPKIERIALTDVQFPSLEEHRSLLVVLPMWRYPAMTQNRIKVYQHIIQQASVGGIIIKYIYTQNKPASVEGIIIRYICTQ